MVLQLKTDLASQLVRSRPADRINGETARPIEISRFRTTFDHRDLRNVVARRLGGERAVLRPGHIDAIEQINVVLSVTAGARPSKRLRRLLNAGRQLDDVAVLLADR